MRIPGHLRRRGWAPATGRREDGPGRRRARATAVVVAGGLAVSLVGGCSGEQVVGSDLCPADTNISTKPASSEVTGLLDFTGSFDYTSEQFLRQVDAIVVRAVDSGSALRIMTFSGAASSVRTLLLCVTTEPDGNSDAAAAAIREDIQRTLTEAARNKVTHAPPGADGTDIWGAWSAYSDAERLAGSRTAIMLTDGQQTKRTRVPLRLAGVRAEMWNIGRLQDAALPSEKAAELVRIWETVLTEGGSTDVEVSTSEYQGVGR
ncbi:hypothetical protein AB1460_09095 [Parafrankia sp. FMc2]